MEFDIGKDFGVRQEAQFGTALAGWTDLLERIYRLSFGVFLLMVEAVAPDIQPK